MRSQDTPLAHPRGRTETNLVLRSLTWVGICHKFMRSQKMTSKVKAPILKKVSLRKLWT